MTRLHTTIRGISSTAARGIAWITARMAGRSHEVDVRWVPSLLCAHTCPGDRGVATNWHEEPQSDEGQSEQSWGSYKYVKNI